MAALVLAASPADASDQVSSLLKKARAEAKHWQRDAVLVEITATVGQDGTLPPQTGAMFNFLSKSKGQGLMVAIGAGQVQAMPMPVGQATLSLPDTFIDPSRAVTQARTAGLKGSSIAANLRGYDAETGEQFVWRLTTHDPAAGTQTFWVDARSGALTSYENLTGATDAARRSKHLQEKSPPTGPSKDFTVLRREADALAATQHLDFKLFQIEAWLRGRPEIYQARFHYFRKTKPVSLFAAAGWEELQVNVDTHGMRGERGEGRGPLPAPVPGTILTPEEAFQRLGRGPLVSHLGGLVKAGRAPEWDFHVQLVLGGIEDRRNVTGFRPNEDTPEHPFFNQTAPAGKWIWWAVSQDKSLEGKRLEYLYLDAATGRATSHCAELPTHHIGFPTGLVAVSCTPPPRTPSDFASVRKAADDFAAASDAGFRLWRIDLIALTGQATLQIRDAEFHYFRTLPGGEIRLLRALVKPVKGLYLPEVQENQYSVGFNLGGLKLVPVPSSVKPPDEVLRLLGRTPPGEESDSTGTFKLKLMQVGVAPNERSRWEASGVLDKNADFFYGTAPAAGTWIWWTIMTQNRPYPGSNPKGAGTPRRVQEFLYLNAMTGELTSHCRGILSDPIPCR